MQILKETKMNKITAIPKNLNEDFSASATDPEKLVRSDFNISHIENPVEMLRLNNFINSVTAFKGDISKKAMMNELRLRLNLIGFDFDIPQINETAAFSHKVPLKRFGGILGIDDMGEKLENPYGPGQKFDLLLSTEADGTLSFSAKVIPFTEITNDVSEGYTTKKNKIKR